MRFDGKEGAVPEEVKLGSDLLRRVDVVAADPAAAANGETAGLAFWKMRQPTTKEQQLKVMMRVESNTERRNYSSNSGRRRGNNGSKDERKQ